MPRKDPEERKQYERERAARRRQDPEYREQQKRYKQEHKDELHEYMLKWQRANRSKMHGYHDRSYLKRTYGITLEKFTEMLAVQGGACACCGRKPGDPGMPKRRFAVDHDHVTGKIRGILCFSCNVGIGSLGDSIEGLKKALAYLEASPQQS